MAYRAIAKVLRRTFSNFNVARGGSQSVLALFQIATLIGGAYSTYQGSWWALFLLLSLLLLVTAAKKKGLNLSDWIRQILNSALGHDRV
jgi:hypothetical protein